MHELYTCVYNICTIVYMCIYYMYELYTCIYNICTNEYKYIKYIYNPKSAWINKMPTCAQLMGLLNQTEL